MPELIDSLTEIAIRDGNAAMAKLALQINGMLTDRIEVETTGPDQVDVGGVEPAAGCVQGPSYTIGGLDGQ
ncbi:hypothetical protein P7H19_10490 [Paenibacillus larvae]|nr:hypothetical protein [Paenibacillus larvae]MDT2236633.1 hypothetical protein [Paenibacillus larvae]